ncbi:MAG: TetR/AcrR family transcriptional regulator [Gemmatimonadales bacterium]
MSTNDTRRRIVESIVELHEQVGPAATTVTAIAERAGVQRLTVYRHFPDDRAMLGACSSHWNGDHPLPDPASWTGITDPQIRLETALRGLYAYFRDGAPMLASILRDEAEVPELAEVMAPMWDYFREVAGGLSAGWGVTGDSQRRVRAAVGHALGFPTWRSLTDQGLSNAEAVELMVGLVADVAAEPRGFSRARNGEALPE